MIGLRYPSAIALLTTLAPLLILQGRHLRRHAVRLPPAQGERCGVERGPAPSLDLLVLGESTAAGVGVAQHGESLAGQLATGLARRLRREIRWEVAGLNGLTAARTAEALFPRVGMRRATIAVLALGVNDTLALRSPRRWLAELTALTEEVQNRFQPQLVAVCAVPPVGRFVAIPQPLRAVLGQVAASLDAATRRALQGRRDILYVPLPAALQRDRNHLAADGFHPSARGYAVWGSLLAEAIAQRHGT